MKLPFIYSKPDFLANGDIAFKYKIIILKNIFNGLNIMHEL